MAMEQDKLTQIAAFIVAIIVGVLGYFRGKPKPDSESAEQAELSRLRIQVIEDRERRIAEEIRGVREDFEKIIGSVNVSLRTQINEVGGEITELSRQVRAVDERVHAAERKLDVVEDRQRRSQ